MKGDGMHKFLMIGLLAGNILCGHIFSAGADDKILPELMLPGCAAPPALDGRLDDACWALAAAITNLHMVGPAGGMTGRHKIMVCRDAAWLYAGFRVDQPILDRNPPAFRRHDEDVQREDNVQVSFDPGTDGKLYYQFLVSPINTRADFRMTRARGRDREGWNIPWRSAAVQDDAGWSVEMALPLGLLMKDGDAERVRFNAIVLTYVVERDLNTAQVGLNRVKYSWAPLRRHFAEPENFGMLHGLDAGPIETPALPYINAVRVEPYGQEAGQSYYAVAADVQNLGRQAGRFKFSVLDQPAEGAGRTAAQEMEIPPGVAPLTVRLRVPVETFSLRAAEAALADAAGEIWQTILLEGDAMELLNVFGSYLDRNYYTSEEAALAMCSVRLPGEMMAGMTMRAVDGTGRVLARTAELAPELSFPIPLADLPAGSNCVRLELCGADGQAAARREVAIVKRAPHPDGEWKVDQDNRVLLRNGKPFFPFGFVLGSAEDWAFRDVAAMGMNCVYYHLRGSPTNLQGAIADAQTFMESAARHGLQVVFYPDRYFQAIPPDNSLQDMLTAQQFEQLSKIVGGRYFRNLTSLRSALVTDAVLKSLPARVKGQVFFSVYKQQTPALQAMINAVKSMRNLMGYCLFDEPNIPGVDQDVAGRHYYNLVHELDGHHPVFVVYNTLWDTGDYRRRTTDWCDALVQDPYWVPAAGRYRPSLACVTHVAKMVARTKRLADSAHRVTVTMPQSEYWSGSRKRALTPAEQRCQTYLALIHGSKGIIYFTYRINSQLIADTIRTLAEEMKILGPVCLTPELAQRAVYAPGELNPPAGKFTDIQVSLRRNPAGGFVLLCANTMDCPVDVKFTISALGAAGTVKRLFGAETYTVGDQSFSDRFEPYATRAYLIGETENGKLATGNSGNRQTENGAAPVEIRVEMTAHPEQALGEPAADAELDRAGKKNQLPNSSFEQAFIPGWPDYYWPAGTRLMPCERIGAEQSVWGVDTNRPYHGKYCLRLGDGGPGRYPQTYNQFNLDPALTRQAARFVLSSWMRANRDGVQIANAIPAALAGETFKLTTQWQRYDMPVLIPAGASLLIIRWYQPGLNADGDTVWIDAAQLEAGDQATEYEP